MIDKENLRSIGAVAAGVAANFLVAVPIDLLLHFFGIFPPMGKPMSDKLLLLAFSYRIIAALLGGYVTARLSPQNPMKHAFILGVVGVILSGAGAAAMWNLGHNWYPFSLVIISIPCSWIGARRFAPHG